MVKEVRPFALWLQKHISTDDEDLVLADHTTTAYENARRGLKTVVKKTPKKNMTNWVWGDKGFKVPDNDKLLKEEKIRNRIQRKFLKFVHFKFAISETKCFNIATEELYPPGW